MKKTTFLKSLLLAAALTTGASAWAESLIFTEDFADENYNVTWGGTSAGGISPTVADGVLKVANGSQSGDRSAYIAFGTNACTGSCHLTFDMAMTKSGWSGKNNNFYVLPTATTDRYPSTTNAALIVTQDNNGAITVAGESVGTYDGTLLTYDLYLDAENKNATLIVKNGANVIKTISYTTTANGINTLHLNFNKNNGAFAIDNISLYSLTNPAFTLAESSKTVSIGSNETVNVTDITGNISVSSNDTGVATVSYNSGTVTINGVSDGTATITVTCSNDGLTIEKTIDVIVGSVTTTTVTVNYLCEGSAITTATEIADVAIGSKLYATDLTYSDVIAGTGCRYANPVFSPALPYTVEENGVININYTRQDAVPSLAVKAKIGSSNYDIKTIDLEGKYVGDVVTFNYPRYFLVGTTLYETSQKAHGDDYYKWDYTLEGSNVEVEYATTVSTNVVYFAEGEIILNSGRAGNSDIRCSDGQGGYVSEANTPVVLKNLAAGCYRIYSLVWGNSGTTYTFKVDGNTVSTIATNGSLNSSASIFVVNADADITVEANESNAGRVLDCLFIEREATNDNIVFNGDFSNATWNSGWGGTGSNKAKAFVRQSGNDWFNGNFAEMWTGNGGSFTNESDIYQIINNVPAGTYKLTANIVNSTADGTAVLYAKVGDDSDVTTDATNLSDKTEKSVVFTVPSASNIRIGFKTSAITGKAGWIAVDDFTLTKTAPLAVSGTIASSGYSSLASAYGLDFANATGLTAAYVVTKTTTEAVTLTSVDELPANSGVILKSIAGTTYNIPVKADATFSGTNLLSAAVTPTVVEDGTAYILQSGEFHLVEGTTSVEDRTIPAGKAYLLASNVPSQQARSLGFRFVDEATGINAVSSELLNGEFYNMQGQRVNAPKKGLYIVNGKKVIIK